MAGLLSIGSSLSLILNELNYIIRMSFIRNRFTFGEELANAISHLAGAVLSLVAYAFMLAYALQHGTIWHIVGVTVFAFSLIFLYVSSTLNHWLPDGKGKQVFYTIDQIAIYLLIAGTYTPMALIAFRDTVGWYYMGIEWGIALAGIVFKIVQKRNFVKSVDSFTIISYVVMGLLIVVNIPLAIEVLSLAGFLFIMGGGVFYISGILFYRWTSLPYSHLVWHIFVILGSAMHFIAIYFYAIRV